MTNGALTEVSRERDEARDWARNLLTRSELEHWLQLRMADWCREDVNEARQVALRYYRKWQQADADLQRVTAERDALLHQAPRDYSEEPG